MKTKMILFISTLVLLALNTADLLTGTPTGFSWLITSVLGLLGIGALCDLLRLVPRERAAALRA